MLGTKSGFQASVKKRAPKVRGISLYDTSSGISLKTLPAPLV